MPKALIKLGNITRRYASKNAKSTMGVNEYNSIEKNYRILTSVTSKADSTNSSKYNLHTITLSARKILESLADSNTANKYALYPLSIAEKFNNIDNKFSNTVIETYCNTIIPYIKDLNYISESINHFNLTDTQKDRILKEANIYNTCDRILNNHDTITKRFKVEDTILNSKYNLKPAIESTCIMIDTYNRDSYQKMNICLEEVFYILEKNGIKYNPTEVANTIVEYFLLSSPELSDKNYNGYKKCITESCFLNEDDIESVKFIFGNRDENASSSIKGYISSYFTSVVKSKELLDETITNCINSDTLDISYNFYEILDFILSVYKSENLISDSDLSEIMDDIEPKISSRIIGLITDADISREILDKIVESLIKSIEVAKSLIDRNSRIFDYIGYIKRILTNVSYYYDFLYDIDNINVINMMENCEVEIPLSEAKVLKAHNLFVAVRNLDKYLGAKCKEVVNKLVGRDKDKPSVRQKIQNVLFNDDKEGTLEKALKKGMENEKKMLKTIGTGLRAGMRALLHTESASSFNPYDYISEESHTFDMTLVNVAYKDDEVDDLQDTLSGICKEFNYLLENDHNMDTLRIYYMINPGEASLHLTEVRKFSFNDDQLKLIREAKQPDWDYAIEKLAEAKTIAEFITTIDNKDIESSLFNCFGTGKNMGINTFDTILECLSIIGIDKKIVSKFADKYNNTKYYLIDEDVQLESETKKVNSLVESYHIEEDAPIDVKFEAYQILDAILEKYDDDDFEDDDDEDDEKSNKKEDDKNPSGESDEEIKKNPFKGLNLKPIKLYIMGVKSRFQNMSQKEKELSKNVDDSFKNLVNSFKNAMISDSREAIIKGSVIPSFSKCLKVGIPAALAIQGGLLNPGVAAIAAIGSFAVSKRLTKKERILLLDEIDTELDVVDKEIAMAEREEDMKKYRALMQYKKNLQRQYQRIRYNVKVGKNILPGSNVGINGDHNNGY